MVSEEDFSVNGIAGSNLSVPTLRRILCHKTSCAVTFNMKSQSNRQANNIYICIYIYIYPGIALVLTTSSSVDYFFISHALFGPKWPTAVLSMANENTMNSPGSPAADVCRLMQTLLIYTRTFSNIATAGGDRRRRGSKTLLSSS